VEDAQPDPKILIDIVTLKMPFGKYKDVLICDIPVSYLEWMHSKGFPQGKLGMLLATVFEMKTNGLGDLLYKLKLASKTGKTPGF
jgi:uncharacterized protein (DUF3820 family)